MALEQIGMGPSLAVDPRDGLVRRAKLLAWIGFGWHLLEAFISIGAGVVAGSVALIGFGADSVVEALAGGVVLWRFGGRRSGSESAEHRAQKLIAWSFFFIAAYVGVDGIRTLISGDHPDVSWVGIGLAAVTLITMPPLARAKGRLGQELRSSATASEGRQNMLCAYLSAGLLVGLGANALFGLWWLDPVTALGIAAVAVNEGREAWLGDLCCEDPLAVAHDSCADEACICCH
jgi:divalent metal cation (Fe/Co/Zn/Cd) transporter